MENKSYDHNKIETNWKEKWFKDNIYKAIDFDKRPKKYILAELPYPSGKFLHVGHMMRYTVPEIYSRFLRMSGFNVLFPMGWDAFGLPAETFAIKENSTPQEVIKKASQDYKKAMQNMGYAIDWDREINTSDPEFYKWTQWTFLQLFKKNLAKLEEMPVWWCNELGVLADEEVLINENGEKVSERGGYKVEKKMFKQWVLKITEYADRLLEDLDKVDYMKSVKEGQKNWIGKSEGTQIKFEIESQDVEVFTTRIDTIFGVTFLVISPEHPIVDTLLQSKNLQNRKQVEEYVEKTKNMSDLERQTKEKTGIELKGIRAISPVEKDSESIPILLANYVLLDYGTGVVMGVPAHDERDLKFAKKYGLDVKQVIDENSILINSGKYNGLTSEDAKHTIATDLEKVGKCSRTIQYKLRDQIFSRQRYWGEPIPLIYKKNGKVEAISEDDLPLKLPVMKDFLPDSNGTSPLKKNNTWIKTKDKEGNPAERESDTMPTWAGSNWYYLRYIDPQNKKELADMEKLKYWLPVDKYFGDAGHTTAHLLYSRFWYKFLYDIGKVPIDEPYKWRMSGGLLLGPDGNKMSKSKGNTINPKDVLEKYGADATRLYLSFIGPYNETYPWNENGMNACYKLVKSIYALSKKVMSDTPQQKVTKEFHKMLKKITQMIQDLKMNTAVSEIMIFTNTLKKETIIDLEIWKDFIKVLAPFAPFISEELWQGINNYSKWDPKNSIHLQDWPKYDENLATEDEITLAIQINGKVRDQITMQRTATKEQVEKATLEQEKVQNYIGENKIKKFIYVPGKIVNIVV